MAAVKANNRRRMVAAAAAADLPDDMIIQIIRHLPLKYAARCRILNKYFYNTISTPRFLLDHHHALSSSNSIILHHSHTKFTRIYSKSLTLPTEHGRGLRIIDSCNGVLLLFFRDTESYSVFNPFTGAVVFLKYKINRLYCGALVVDIKDSSSPYDFKLVELQTKTMLERGVCPPGVLRFRVFVPESKVMMKQQVCLDYEGSFDPLMEQDRGRPVYAHGCVHWLGVGATAIAAFDVGSVRARIMDGPVTHAVDCTEFRIWFGLAQGSLQFMRIDDTDYTIIVHTHNYITQEWRVAHKVQIMTMIVPVGMMDVRLVAVFFDGQNVYVHVKNNKIEDINNTICIHDLSSCVWRMHIQVEEVIEYDSWGKGWGHRYVEYVPTTARVSDFYLPEKPANPTTLKALCLHRLRRLLLLA